MSTGGLQHLLLRAKRWWIVRNLRSRDNTLSLLIDNVEADLAQEALLLTDLQAERRMVRAQLRAIDAGCAAAHQRAVKA